MTLDIDLRRPAARVRPDEALGWSLDGGGEGSNAPLFDLRNRRRLRELARGPISYRLRTELAGEAWHWSAFGRWSDPAHSQGYWTGDPAREDPGAVSYGYRLPRRGNSRDEANDDGWSRLDDGDPATFWKSNPYLAPAPGAAARPEWIKVDLGAVRPVDTLEMLWREPFARRVRVQFWRGESEWSGRWAAFPAGELAPRRAGWLRARLAPAPQPVRFVRLLLEASSGTAPPGSSDPRDRRGFAVAELRLGRTEAGRLRDAIVHIADGRRQTRMVVSSTDPWHRAQDRDPQVEQPSPLRLMRLGLLRPERTMLPVGVLSDTPENAVAELEYFRRFGLRPREVELGEEPEGQRTDPEVFARLYAQLAQRLRARWPGQRLAGPSLINVLADTWLDDDPERSWTRRMLQALGGRAPAPQDGFTLEHYPDDDMCADPLARVSREPAVLRTLFARLRRDGVAPQTPIALTEIGQSAYNGRADVELESGLFAAAALGEFLSRGGAAAYLYAITPSALSPGATPCAGVGDMTPWALDATGVARWPLPILAAFRLVAGVWLQPHGANRLFAPAVGGGDVFAYAALRPDGRRSVLLVNATAQARRVRLRFSGGGSKASGGARLWRYGPAQYAWSAAAGPPLRSAPPSPSVGVRWDEAFTLPPRSLSVVRDR